MYLLDYSLDNLSLMALTLCVGFVVDDAIVMLENIVRHMEMGKPPMRAAFDGSKEVAFTILSMTRVARRGLHPGAVHGRRRRPAAARVRGDDRRRDSGVGVRLDQPDADAVQPLPQAAAHPEARPFLQRDRAHVRGWLRLYDWTLRGEPAVSRRDDGGVGCAARRHRATCSCRVPKGFLPSEDQGRFNISTEAIQGIGFDEMVRHQLQVADIVAKDPERARVQQQRRRRPARRRAEHRAASAST